MRLARWTKQPADNLFPLAKSNNLLNRKGVKILILHLSDIHLREPVESNSGLTKLALVAKAIQNLEAELSGVAVVISGDIAYSGTKAEYAIAIDAFSELESALKTATKLKEIQFIFVPGNHDCDLTKAGVSRKTLIDAIRSGKTPIIDDGVVSLCTCVQSDFFQFRGAFTEPFKDSPIYWEYHCNYDNQLVTFRCYNTAWISQVPEEQGALSFPFAHASHLDTNTPAQYAVSVFHHPYSWMPASTKRDFQKHIEEISDLILTGHEHESQAYHKLAVTGETNEFLEGAVFQEGDPKRSGFHAVFVDMVAQKQRTLTFTWDRALFTSAGHGESWVPYKRGSRGSTRDFELSDDFRRYLNDPGITLTHPAKADLTLQDIFVCPNLREILQKQKSLSKGESAGDANVIVESRDVLKTLGARSKIILYGRSQSGKTTLAKAIFSNLYNARLTPILIQGTDITNSHVRQERLANLVETAFKEQYINPYLPAFQQLDRDKCVIIIEDFDQTHMNAKGRLKLIEEINKRYDRVIILSDDSLKFEEIADGPQRDKHLSEYSRFDIMPFGYLLRSQLIGQWYEIGSDFASNQVDLNRKAHDCELLVTRLLGKNYLPSFPVFILTLIQAQESTRQVNSSVGTFGGLYEMLITDALAKRSPVVNLDLRMTYLSEFAFWMFDKSKKYITDEEWSIVHSKYCSKFSITPSLRELKEAFYQSKLLVEKDGRISFIHPYGYYYFVARYLRDNLSDSSVRSLITSLCKKLYKDEHASIWLFLTHLSKDPFIVETLLAHAQSLFSDLKPATLSTDISFLEVMAQDVEKIVLRDKEHHLAKEDRLRNLDAAPLSPEMDEDIGDEETNETLIFISKLNLAFKTLDVLGQLVKNFPGSLVGADKLALVKECYEMGLRTLALILNVFQECSEELLTTVMHEITKNNPEFKDHRAVETQMKRFVFWMMEISCFGMLKRISLAVGHPQLKETYRVVLADLGTNAAALIDMSVRLDNSDFPEERLIELCRDLKNNIMCERLLQYLVVHHLYVFQTPTSLKQKVCEALDIPIKSINDVDYKSEKVKLTPRKS